MKKATRVSAPSNDLSSRSLGYRLIHGTLLLVALMVVSFLLASPVACMTAGSAGLVASGIAAAVCTLAGIAGFVISQMCLHKMDVFSGLVLGVGVRMFLPLASVFLVLWHRPLLENGMIYYLLLYYLIMLFADIAIILPSIAASHEVQRTTG